MRGPQYSLGTNQQARVSSALHIGLSPLPYRHTSFCNHNRLFSMRREKYGEAAAAVKRSVDYSIERVLYKPGGVFALKEDQTTALLLRRKMFCCGSVLCHPFRSSDWLSDYPKPSTPFGNLK